MRISDWSSDVCSSDLAKAAPRLPFRALGNAKAGAQLLNLRRVHNARMIVLVLGKRQAIALDRIGDEQGRAIVAGAVEGLDQRLTAMADQVGCERGPQLVVKAASEPTTDRTSVRKGTIE